MLVHNLARSIQLSTLAATAAAVFAACASPPGELPGWPGDAFQRPPSAKVRWSDTPTPWIISHRGNGTPSSRIYPENSTAAITSSVLGGGAVGVEVDVMLTSDGELVLMHDHLLDRTTECTGCVSERTLAQIQACRLEPGDAELRPPTLSEAVQALRALPVEPLLMIEVKAEPWDDGCPPVGDAQASHLAMLGRGIGQLLRSSGFSSNTAVQSSAPEVLMALREESSDPLLFALDSRLAPAVRVARSASLHGVAAWEDGLSEPALRDARTAGLLVDAFTVNAPVDLATAVSAGVDMIETDRVEDVLAAFD